MLGNLLSIIIREFNIWGWKHCVYPEKTVGNDYVLAKLDEIENPSVLFYPSSGLDFTDIHYANAHKVSAMKDVFPNVFLHSDAFGRSINDNYSPTMHPMYSLLDEYKWETKERSISIKKYRRVGLAEDFWIIYFDRFCNETVLGSLMSANVKVDVIYAIVDGITLGSGADDRCFEVPTLMYPLFSEKLGFKYIITDQSVGSYSLLRDDTRRERWFSNFRRLSPQAIIDEALLGKLEKSITQSSLNTGNMLNIFGDFHGPSRLFLNEISIVTD